MPKNVKKLVCEMCGSNELLKHDGVFECQSCGTKYSVEEAKKMMVEGTVDVSGSTVKVDDTDKIKNYLMMANNAYDADNKKESENYCNKIIEIEPNNYEAWLLKGKSAGWQSTLANLRIDESINAFQKAIENAPNDKQKEIKNEAIKETTSLCRALISLACKNYAKDGSVSQANTIIEGIITIKRVGLNFLVKCKADIDDINTELAIIINSSVVSAYNKIVKDSIALGYSDYAINSHAQKTKSAIILLEMAINLCGDDKENKIQIYKNLIVLTDGIVKPMSFNSENSKQLLDKIMEYHKEIKELDPDYEIPEISTNNESTGVGRLFIYFVIFIISIGLIMWASSQ